ncbi:MAG: hypothetical protein ABW123_06180 [Cystobacter sp.]
MPTMHISLSVDMDDGTPPVADELQIDLAAVADVLDRNHFGVVVPAVTMEIRDQLHETVQKWARIQRAMLVKSTDYGLPGPSPLKKAPSLRVVTELPQGVERCAGCGALVPAGQRHQH